MNSLLKYTLTRFAINGEEKLNQESKEFLIEVGRELGKHFG
jgi:ferritin-like protein